MKIKTSSKKQKIKNIIFIVSSGRAGTTLLRTMLNAGGEIHFPHESDFIARAYPVYGHRNNLSYSDYPEAVKFFKRTSQKGGWGIPEDFFLNFINTEAPKNFLELNVAFISAYLSFHEISISKYGIKTPVLIADIDTILDVFPDAKIIHVVRDGRDVFLSYRKVHENDTTKPFGPNSIITSVLYWIDGLRRVEKHVDSIYEIRYEDLLSNPKDELEGLCDYIGINYSPVMHENFFMADNNKDTILEDHKNTIHEKIAKGLDSKNQGKYLTQMTRNKRLLFELIASPYLDKYNYSLEYKIGKISLLLPCRKIVYAVVRLFNNVRYWLRDKKTYAHAKRNLNSK